MTLSGMGYHTSAGETFDLAAFYLFGSEKYAAELLNANPEYAHKAVFDGSEFLSIPVVDTARKEYTEESAPWRT